jgi:hypothetical protein
VGLSTEEKTKRVLVLVGVAPQHASSCPQEERKGVSAPSGHQRKQFRLVEVGVRVFPGYSESAERVDDREGEPHELVSGFEDLCHLQATRIIGDLRELRERLPRELPQPPSDAVAPAVPQVHQQRGAHHWVLKCAFGNERVVRDAIRSLRLGKKQ